MTFYKWTGSEFFQAGAGGCEGLPSTLRTSTCELSQEKDPNKNPVHSAHTFNALIFFFLIEDQKKKKESKHELNFLSLFTQIYYNTPGTFQDEG